MFERRHRIFEDGTVGARNFEEDTSQCTANPSSMSPKEPTLMFLAPPWRGFSSGAAKEWQFHCHMIETRKLASRRVDENLKRAKRAIPQSQFQSQRWWLVSYVNPSQSRTERQYMINETSGEPRVTANGIIVSNDGNRRLRTKPVSSDTNHCEMEHGIV